MQNCGSQPREIFEDIINEEKEVLRKVKPLFKSLVKDNGIRFANTSYATFDQTLQNFPEYLQMSAVEKTLVHEYYLEKVKQKE